MVNDKLFTYSLFIGKSLISVTGGRFPPAWLQPLPLLLRKLVAKINFATLSPGSSAHAIPAGVAAFPSNQLAPTYSSKNLLRL
ncbi:hypothetical protein FG384_17085 [Psychrobacillus vulpis]|uniref:Uncharacterized protein n=1 Tax=Psychrobacillus vulpis TaxID=2325572 RepID=A0A544TK56_9BACI|nr:hypothetical protein FG384_17085 [Psychrobacillus vulpis]